MGAIFHFQFPSLKLNNKKLSIYILYLIILIPKSLFQRYAFCTLCHQQVRPNLIRIIIDPPFKKEKNLTFYKKSLVPGTRPYEIPDYESFPFIRPDNYWYGKKWFFLPRKQGAQPQVCPAFLTSSGVKFINEDGEFDDITVQCA